MAAVTGAIVGGVGMVAGVVGSIDAQNKARRAERSAEARLNKALSERKDVINPYSNLSVDTKTAEFEAQQSDQALSNALDAMLQGDMGAGGATAVAQAALTSKQNIGQNIRAQEEQNRILEAKGRQIKWEGEETRNIADINRYAGMQQQFAAQKAQAQADMWSGITSGVMSIGSGISAAYANEG
jgi:hypothetical protein